MSMAWAAYAREVTVDSISSSSKLGQKILSKARRLDEEDQEIDITWMTGYDLKFQGCFETSAWNAEGDGEDAAKVMTKRLVRFRLCPSGSCSDSSASGCSSGYGDYLVDLNQFLDTWSEAKMQKEEYDCEQVREACGCGENDQDDDEEACEYTCYTNANMGYCIEEEGQFELQRYTYCGEVEMPENDDDNRRRRLDEEEEEALFLGPYCSSQGGSIHLGMFTEETCSTQYDSYYGRDYYYEIFGTGMPYSQSNLVGLGCKSCIMEVYDNGDERRRKLDNGGDYVDANGNYIAPICYESYFGSAKCEENLGIDDENNYGCNYMEGIKVVRAAGTVTELNSTPSKSASAFIGIFAVSFVVLGAYVYYLKTKLDKAKINLDE